jgi:hypothetical protein
VTAPTTLRRDGIERWLTGSLRSVWRDWLSTEEEPLAVVSTASTSLACESPKNFDLDLFTRDDGHFGYSAVATKLTLDLPALYAFAEHISAFLHRFSG